MPPSFKSLIEKEQAEFLARPRREAAIPEQFNEHITPSVSYSTARRLAATYKHLSEPHHGKNGDLLHRIELLEKKLDVINEQLNLVIDMHIASMGK